MGNEDKWGETQAKGKVVSKDALDSISGGGTFYSTCVNCGAPIKKKSMKCPACGYKIALPYTR